MKKHFFIICLCFFTKLTYAQEISQDSFYIEKQIKDHEITCPQEIYDTFQKNYPDYKNYSFQCGTVRVPLYYDKPSLQHLTLTFLYFPAKDGVKTHPFVYTAGGPESSIRRFLGGDFKLFTPIIDQYGLLVYNYRGEIFSSPLPHVKDDVAYCDGTPLTDPSQWPAEMQKCLNFLKQNSTYDFYAITTENIAHDLSELISQLGFRKIHYYGFSYSSLIGQYVAMLHPEVLKTMTLEAIPLYGTFFWNDLDAVQKTLVATDRACLKDDDCSKQFGPISPKYTLALYDLNLNPVYLDNGNYKVGDLEFSSMLSAMINSWNMGNIYNTIENYRNTNTLMQWLWPFSPTSTEPIYPLTWLSANCPESGLDLKSPSPYQFKHLPLMVQTNDAVCKVWFDDFPKFPHRIRLKMPKAMTQVPVLLISGDMDLLTPSYHANYLKEQIDSNLVQHVTYTGMGHGLHNEETIEPNCVVNNMLKFLSHPKDKITHICESKIDFTIHLVKQEETYARTSSH